MEGYVIKVYNGKIQNERAENEYILYVLTIYNQLLLDCLISYMLELFVANIYMISPFLLSMHS